MKRWIALALSVGALSLASWILIPAPTYFLLTFGVGAPEVSPGIAVGALVLLAIVVRDAARSRISAAAAVVSGIAFALALIPALQFRGAVSAFDDATRAMAAEPMTPARTARFVARDFVRGIDIGEAKVTTGVVFARPEGRPLALDVYQPRERGRHPILIQIYGGAWQRGTPRNDANFATLMASHGWVVFAVDYRHAPEFHWASIVSDVDSSLVWIRDHAAEFDGDTSRVALIGRSAGGHLAKMAAYRCPPLGVRGVVSYYGPADLIDAYKHPPHPDPLHIRSVEEAFIGGTLEEKPQDFADASPASYIDRPLPPTLLVYGRKDHIVEAHYGRWLRDKLSASGTPVAYLEIPWAEHAFDAVFSGLSSQLALYYVERFLTWSIGH